MVFGGRVYSDFSFVDEEIEVGGCEVISFKVSGVRTGRSVEVVLFLLGWIVLLCRELWA